MTTTDIRYVNPGSSGGNGTTSALSGANAAYASLNAAQVAYASDLTVSDTIIRFLCDGTTADTTRCAWSTSWKTSSTQYISVENVQNHSGVWDTSQYRYQPAFSSNVSMSTNGVTNRLDIKFIGIQFSNASISSSFGRIFYSSSATLGTYSFEQCIFRGVSTGTGSVTAIYTNSTHVINLRNCIFYSFSSVCIEESSPAVTKVYNCTFAKNALVGSYPTGGGGAYPIFKSCLFVNNTSDMTGTLSGTNFDYCSTTSATTLAGTHTRYSQTFSFADYTNDNYHLLSSDTGAIGFGVDLSGDAYPVTIDVDSVARTGTYDIGADQYVSGGVSGSDITLRIVP